MGESELKVFIGLSRTLNHINRVTGKIHHHYGLTTPQFGVLEALYHKGDLTIGEVQEKILSTSGTIPVIVRNLEKEGLLVRKQDEADRRRFYLHITEKGRALMDQVYPENEGAIREMLGIFSEEEQENLIQCFKKFGGAQNEEKY